MDRTLLLKASCAFGAFMAPLHMSAMAGDENYYAEIGYTRFGLDILGRDFDPTALQLRGGYRVNPVFGVEVEAAYSLNGATIKGTTDTATLKFDQSLAGFVLAKWPLTQRVDVIGRVGYQKIDASIKVEQAGLITFQQKGKGEGFIYGVGVAYKFDGFGLRADYTWSGEASPFPTSERIETLSLSLSKSF